jgi:hypothetical protein
MTSEADRYWSSDRLGKFDFEPGQAVSLSSVIPARMKLEPPNERSISGLIALDAFDHRWLWQSSRFQLAD